MKQIFALTLVSLVTLGAPALAETSSAQRAACTPDVWRLCASEIPDVGAIKSCLRREKPRLSPACRTVMDDADKQAVSTKVALNQK